MTTLALPSYATPWPKAIGDWVYGIVLLGTLVFGLLRWHPLMDGYEEAIAVGTTLTALFLGWHWKPIRLFLPAAALLALLAAYLYQGDLARAGQLFMLKYFLSSQIGITWMTALFILGNITYLIGLVRRSSFALASGSGFTWAACLAGFTAMLVRWHESYLLGPDGHIPVSNLYEVFVLFCLITALLYLYYEGRYQVRQLGGFVLLIIVAALAFLWWYSLERGAQEIQPLIPALQSWWMKIHVPANFIGYGAFSAAAMCSVAWLLATPHAGSEQWHGRFYLAAALLLGFGLWLQFDAKVRWPTNAAGIGLIAKMAYAGVALMIVATKRGRLAKLLPDPAVIENLSYRAISLGFLFFTLATILGALWAAEAWGGYWSWDPKETWALIVWLNYAAWLHLRLMKGLTGEVLAWWSLVGLYLTTFAFLGVNMWLSGLHAYGNL